MERINYSISIEELCYQAYHQDHNGLTNSNLGGWQSDDINYPDSPFFFILSDIEKVCQKICTDVLKIKGDFSIGNTWININRKGNSNLTHTHPKTILSGVYYAKTPENSGEIVFFHPAYDMMIRDWDERSIVSYNDINSLTMKCQVEKGLLYIFPPWIKHYVNPNQSDEERISIAFNIIDK